MVKIAINGFGRIGRLIMRAAMKRNMLGKQFDLVAINDPGDVNAAAHLLKYDSVHGVLENKIEVKDNALVVDGKKIAYSMERDPANLPWAKLGVEVVLECTGAFTKKEDASRHLKAGAKKVIVSAPCKGDIDATLVLGVNDKTYDKGKHTVVSMASCTTNCLAPMAMVLNSNFKIKKGYMTTVHAYTNDQRILDLAHKDLRRARAAALSIIPTTTGAASALGLVLPELAGKLDGISLRVPIPDGSITDLVVELEKEVSIEDINAAFKAAAAAGSLKGILQYTDEPLVSSDIVGNPHSCIFDSKSTMVLGGKSGGKGTFVKLLGWYDNEWGFSNRMVELSLKML
jgi:glyceraldehyde 3-phosphate dehydrogenase